MLIKWSSKNPLHGILPVALPLQASCMRHDGAWRWLVTESNAVDDLQAGYQMACIYRTCQASMDPEQECALQKVKNASRS